MTLTCCSDLFLARISSPARRGKRVKIFEGVPSLGNPNWFAGAYGASLPQDGQGGRVLKLSDAAKVVLSERCSGFPLAHESGEHFSAWMNEEIQIVGGLVLQHSPQTFWTVGRSQKIINIFLKYCCAAFHSSRPEFDNFRHNHPGVANLTVWLHAPVDRATIKHLIRCEGAEADWGTSSSPLSWWRAMTQAQYNDMQTLLHQCAVLDGFSRIHYEMIHIW